MGRLGPAFGQVVPYLKHDHREIVRHYGPDRGARIIDAVAAGPARVAALIERLGIACDLRRTGLIFGAHTPAGARTLEARATYWRDRGAPVEMLDAAASRAMIGSEAYDAALLDHRGIHLNPLAYTRGLALAAAAQGARIVSDAQVRALRREGGRWVLTVGAHTVEAEAVILATNAYTDGLWPHLATSIVPLRGHGVVSAPLSDNLRRSILPGGQALTDTRRLFSGVRILPDGRLHASLDGPALGPEAGPNLAKVEARLARLFPHLVQIRWDEAWSGFVAMTPDHFPRAHVLGPGLFAGLGYSGRGIAAATMVGAELAARVRGVAETELVFPATPPRPIALHRFAAVPLQAVMAWSRLRDAMDDRRAGGTG